MLLPKLKKIDFLLVFVPVTLALEFTGFHDPLILFVCAILGILPLASKMGEATEELAKHFGGHVGGLLNATFGNAAELIIALLAINKGLLDLVKASITGSIIGNLLFVLGISILVAGFKYKEQKISSALAGLNSTMLLIAVISMMIPSIFHLFPETHNLSDEVNLSLIISVLLILVYAASLLFSLKTHNHLFINQDEHHEKPHMSKRDAAILLGIATALLAVLAEVLVAQVEAVGHTVGLSEIFIGAVVVAVVGNAAEHLAAIFFALKNEVDVAINITVGSSLQIALFVAPVVVIVGELMGKPMDLVFTPFEAITMFASVLVVNEITNDTKVNWFEGVQLLVLYIIIAALFFFIK